MHDDYAFSQAWRLIKGKDWRASEFDLEKAYCLALFAELAYYQITNLETERDGRIKLVPCRAYREIILEKHQNQLGALLSNFDIPEPVVIEGDYVVIHVTRVRNLIFVAVRGTAAAYDWLYNLNAAPKAVIIDGGRFLFHRGFLTEVNNHLGALVSAMQADASGESPLYFTGHSLGGAVAGLFNALWNIGVRTDALGTTGGRKLPRSLGSYTFGMPRFAMRKTAHSIAAPFHIRRMGDPVPNVPPAALGFGTFEDEYWPDGSFARRGGLRGIVRPASWAHAIKSIKFLANHDVTAYRQEIAAKLKIASPDKLLPYDRKEWPGAHR
jgi:hypothetical protein